ncbi:hypothetical protein GCM10008018_15000 [Paenibacillus marchantiophytorum]|uniref:Uncharacterized protein n=1 Tax=Paenibacillus marchantiophytorum TaxID=1619310 RepID=A0ABQ2BRN6_9BACL|nr:hypothetical protein [Paenibacillus marchantiophytorum]GGI46013.1 hypothetical protein GCM10008018_15000 [Paenibacillus marchantiophytorum]
MLKKKILTFSLATIISVSSVASFSTTRVSAVGPDDFAGIVVDVGQKFIIPLLHQLANRDQANGGSDVEFKYFLPAEFKEGKFSISAFNYFNPKGTDTIYTVKAYPKNDPKNPSVYNLKSGDELELNTGFDTSEYILEFYKAGETTPFGNYYLSKEFKNKNYGIALAQNNNIYYLQKETGTVYNDDLIEFYSGGKYDQYKPYLVSKRGEFIDNILRLYPDVRNQLYRQSKSISKGNMSLPQFTQNLDVSNLLKNWQDNESLDGYLKNIEAIRITEENSAYNESNIPTRIIYANADVTIGKTDAYYVDTSAIGVKPNGYLKYRLPVLKEGLYKINGDIEGVGKLIYGYKDRATGHFHELNITESFTKGSDIYVWLKAGVNELKLINNKESDIKFKNITVDYLSGRKDYITSANNSVNITDLSNFKGSGTYPPVFKNNYLLFYRGSNAQFNINAPSKGKYLITIEASIENWGETYEMSLSNLTNNTSTTENIYLIADATPDLFGGGSYSPVTVGTKTIDLEQGNNTISFKNIIGIVNVKSIRLLKIS